MITKNTGDNFLIIKVYHFQIIWYKYNKQHWYRRRYYTK
jgi:hypothetical protein